jgi:mono/diheme cytochrome c family protein
MKSNIVISVLQTVVVSGLLLSSGISFAVDEGMQTKIGENEFMKSCAACHGESAKGDGPVADVLKTTPSNLRLISQRNSGKFPTTKIYSLIDGGAMLGPHGNKEMPIWGDRYRADAISQISGIPHDLSPEAIVHGRILSLVYYLDSIQK